MALVLDASVTLGWSFEDEQTTYAVEVFRHLDDNLAIVPTLWAYEVANGLLIAERRGRVAAGDARRIAAILSALPIETREVTLSEAFGRVLDLARTHALSAYDAAYLDLAMREGLPLATLDDRLRAAAHEAGVPIAE